MKTAPALAAAVILAACVPHVETVVKQEPAALSREAVFNRWQARSRGLPDTRTGPLTVERAIEEALAAVPELEQIRQRIKAAAEQVRQADAAFYPRLILVEDFNITDNPVYGMMDIINQRRFRTDIDFNNPGTQQNFGSRIRGEWSLFEGGARWYDRKAADAQRRSVEAELPAARNQMVAKVIEVYYRWLQAVSFVGVSERALESAQTDERLGETRVRADAALPSELTRLKARSAEARGNLVTARTGARKLQAGLERLIVRPIRPDEVPDHGINAAVPEQVDEDRENCDEYIKAALVRRPEMAGARAMIEAAAQRVRSAHGGLLPRLKASVDYGADSEDLGDFADSWFVGIQATWPLFEGGLSLSRIEEARSRLREMESKGEQIALDIALEVNQAALTVRESAEKIRVADERRKWAEKALEEVRQIYARDAATVDSLLQAEVAWYQAEVSHTASLYEAGIARACLGRALGEFADGISKVSE